MYTYTYTYTCTYTCTCAQGSHDDVGAAPATRGEGSSQLATPPDTPPALAAPPSDTLSAEPMLSDGAAAAASGGGGDGGDAASAARGAASMDALPPAVADAPSIAAHAQANARAHLLAPGVKREDSAPAALEIRVAPWLRGAGLDGAGGARGAGGAGGAGGGGTSADAGRHSHRRSASQGEGDLVSRLISSELVSPVSSILQASEA